MREYSILRPGFWTGDTGRAIRGDADAQRVALYLVTCGSANMIGLFYLPLPTLCHEVGIGLDDAAAAMARLSELGFVHWDPEGGQVFVVEMAAHQIGAALQPADKRVKAIAKMWLAMRKTAFFQHFFDRYAAAFHLPASLPEGRISPFQAPSEDHRTPSENRAPSKALGGPFEAPSKPGAGAGPDSLPRGRSLGRQDGVTPHARTDAHAHAREAGEPEPPNDPDIDQMAGHVPFGRKAAA